MQDFQNLEVWRIAHLVTLEIYKSTQTFPTNEQYGLTSQLRRAAASIGANLAEGCCRGSDKDFARFIQIAMGSASELIYHLILARDLSYLDANQFSRLETETQRVKKMLASLLRKLRT